MCKHSGEDNNHLFLHCVVARLALLCDAFFSDGVVVLVGGGRREVWQAVPLCLLWCIWRECNAHCFEGQWEERGERREGGGDLNLDVNI